MGLWYISRGEVKESLQFGDTAVIDRAVDKAIEYASRKAETDLNRAFLPTLATLTFDWPAPRSPYSYRLWFDGPVLLRADAVTSGGVTLDPADYLLGPANASPAECLEINLGSSGSFSSGDTYQRAVSITGLWGQEDGSESAGTLVGAINASVTSLVVSDGSLVDVGTILQAGTERMQVTRTAWLDSTQNLGVALGDELTDRTVSVSDGTAFHEGELILIGAERLRITDIAGNSLTVERGQDGTQLAAHLLAADVYVRRSATVVRGVLGTTAASHLDGAALDRYKAPGVLAEFVTAESIADVLQKASGYARMVGEGEGARPASGAALEDVRKAAMQAYGRRYRVGAV